MAFRGRGRGRGGFGSFHHAAQLPFELFPEIKDFPDAKSVKEEMGLVVWSFKLQKFWNSSPYFIDGDGETAKKKDSTEIKRYSDNDLGRTRAKPPLSHFIRVTDEYVPAELCGKKERHAQKRVRWNPESDLQKFDLFEKLEQKFQGQEEKGENEDKEGEEEEKEDDLSGGEDEFSDDNDYNQNRDFDDDEDDFNMGDDNDGTRGISYTFLSTLHMREFLLFGLRLFATNILSIAEEPTY
ncbi:hypothetical protein RJ639_020133 [Escallonia herrerae]|uniref:DNA-directed RNA polymerase III subunit n=1 Tax=Escallonia herrerae TaxID=1293975 RepID=A0AA88V6B2_9ASTE|nr:hypothetical protein RJ639_020133 [Escallonia herrerae]